MEGLRGIGTPAKKAGGICPIHQERLAQDVYEHGEPFWRSCVKKSIEDKRRALDRKNTRDIVAKYFNRYSLVYNPEELTYSFDKFKATKGTKEYEIKQTARRLAGVYLKDRKAKFNTIFFGAPGSGKTLLAMSMIKGINDNAEPPQRCVFINVNRLMDKVFSSINNPYEIWTKNKAIEIIGGADTVVLDDLGTESHMTAKGEASEFVQHLLYSISNQPTRLIITTNLTQDQFRHTYNEKIISRLFAGSKSSIVEFTGIKDKRQGVMYGTEIEKR